MFTRKKVLLERLEKVEQMLAQVLEQRTSTPDPSLATAFGSLAAAVEGGLAARYKAASELDLEEMKLRAEARQRIARSRRAGGQARARAGARDATGRFLPGRAGAPASDCALCLNPHFSRPTVQMIQTHRLHEAAIEARSSSPAQPQTVEPSSAPASSNGATTASE